MYKFYYPNGKLISGENAGRQFVQFYSQIYYYLNRDIGLENRIENILTSTNPLEMSDMADILQWKTDSQEENGFIKARHAISVKKVLNIANAWRANCAFDGSPDDEKIFKQYFSSLVNPEKDGGVAGMGTVYALTILYFISNGRYPIFDSFAYYAITAIYENKDIIDFAEELSFGSKFEKIFSTYKEKYCERIQTVFSTFGYTESEIFSNRDIDRALWVYGHLFNQTKTNELYKRGLREIQRKL